MLNRIVCFIFTFVTVFAQPSSYAITPSKHKLATHRALASMAVQKFENTKNVVDFIKAYDFKLSPADKKFLIQSYKNKAWPKIKLKGDTIHFGKDVVLKVIDLEKRKFAFNGVEVIIDPTMPLKLQNELILRKLQIHDKQQEKNVMYDLVLPRAEAWIPLLIAGAIGAAKWILTLSATALIVNSVNTYVSTGGGPLNSVVCMVMPGGENCQTEDGTVKPVETLNSSTDDEVVIVAKEKCPDPQDGSYSFSIYRPATKTRSIFKVETQQSEDKVIISKITETVIRNGVSDPDPKVYVIEDGSLSHITWTDVEIVKNKDSGEIIETKLHPRRLGRDAMAEGSTSLEKTSENQAIWDSSRATLIETNKGLQFFCSQELNDLLNTDAIQPSVTIPGDSSKTVQ